MKKHLGLALLFVLMLAARGDPWGGGGWDTGGGSGGAASITGGSCSDPTGAVVSLDTAGLPSCGAVAQTSVDNLTTDLANLAAQIGSVGTPGAQGTYVTGGGCGVIWSGSGYVYNVSACSAYIQGTLYSAAATNVTLAAAHATLDRFDAIVLTSSNTLDKVTGTAATNPAVPSIDPQTQFALTYVFVTANTSSPASASNESVYAENVEWTSTAGTGWSCADTGNPRTGSKDCKATAVSSNASTKFVRSSTLTLNSYQQLVLWIAPGSGTWNANRSLQITIRDANAVQVGNAVTVQNGSFGFDRTSTTYQLVAIPLSLFAVPSGVSVKEVRLNPTGSGGTFTFYVDDVSLQSTTNSLVPGATYAVAYRAADGSIGSTGPGTSGLPYLSQGASSPPVATTLAEAAIALTDVTTNNASTSNHGFLKKLDNTATHFMDGTGAWSTPAASVKAFWQWSANQAILPSTSYAQFDTRNNHAVLAYDAAADECAYFAGILSPTYGGGGLTVDIDWMGASATSGAVGWLTAFERNDTGTDLDSDSFATANSASTTTSATSGAIVRTTIAHTNGSQIDSVAAGESFRLRVCRDGDGSTVTDSMTGDAQAITVDIREP